MGRPIVRRKFLFVGDEKVWVRGISHGTFYTDETRQERLTPEIVAKDFAQIAGPMTPTGSHADDRTFRSARDIPEGFPVGLLEARTMSGRGFEPRTSGCPRNAAVRLRRNPYESDAPPG